MNDTSTDPITSGRAARYAEARSLLGPDVDDERAMRLAEWLETGRSGLDPVRLHAAARSLAAQCIDSAGVPTEYDYLSPAEQAGYDGRAAQIVLAYLDAR